MKKFLIVILYIVTALMVVSCSVSTALPQAGEWSPLNVGEGTEVDASFAEDAAASASPQPTVLQAEDGRGPADVTIGFSLHSRENAYAGAYVSQFELSCQQMGANFEVVDAQGDAEKQIADITEMIQRGFGAIVISPVNESALVDICTQAEQARIPVISVNAIPMAAVTVMIDLCDYECAYESATQLVEQLGEAGSIACLTPSGDSWSDRQRKQAFDDALAEAGIEAVAESEIESVEDGAAEVEKMLSRNEGITAIWCGDDNALMSAGQAVKLANRKDIQIGGVGGIPEVRQLMTEGYVSAVALPHLVDCGEKIAQAAVSAALGLEQPEVVTVSYDLYTAGESEEMAKNAWG